MSKKCPVSIGCQISEELSRRLDVQVKLSGLSKNRFLMNVIDLYVSDLEVSNQSETESDPLKREEQVLKQESAIGDDEYKSHFLEKYSRKADPYEVKEDE
jgi:hypothetical protein